MKAIVQTGPESVTVEERDRPSPAPDEVLVEVHSAGICGSDAHAFSYMDGYEWIQLPRIMGHEYAGEVVTVGETVTQFEPGDKVVEEPVHSCGECFQCQSGQPNVCQDFSITGMHRDGAYTEYRAVHPRHLHRIPEDVPLRHAAITEPTSVAARAVLEQPTVTPGDTVLVEGPGPIGILVAVIADSLGADVLVSGLGKDTAYRLPLVADLGIETVNVQEQDLKGRVDEFTAADGVSVVFDTTGHRSGVETAVEQVRKGGQVVVVGLPDEPSELFMTPIVRGEIDVNTSFGSTWQDFERALKLMQNGTIEPPRITDTSFDVDEPDEAFRAFLAGETVKPVFDFSQH